jgi:hypothetical protein
MIAVTADAIAAEPWLSSRVSQLKRFFSPPFQRPISHLRSSNYRTMTRGPNHRHHRCLLARTWPQCCSVHRRCSSRSARESFSQSF